MNLHTVELTSNSYLWANTYLDGKPKPRHGLRRGRQHTAGGRAGILHAPPPDVNGQPFPPRGGEFVGDNAQNRGGSKVES